MVPSNQGLFKLDSTLEMAWYKPHLYKCQTEAIEKRLASGHMKGSGKASLPVLMSLSGPFCYSKVAVYMDKSWTWGNVECVQVWQDGTWRILEFGRKWGKRGKTVKRGSQKAGKGTGQRLGIPGNEVCPAHKFPKALQYCLLIFLIHFTRERDALQLTMFTWGQKMYLLWEESVFGARSPSLLWLFRFNHLPNSLLPICYPKCARPLPQISISSDFNSSVPWSSAPNT